MAKIKGSHPPIGVLHGPDEDLPSGTRSFLELFRSDDTSKLDKVCNIPEIQIVMFLINGTELMQIS